MTPTPEQMPQPTRGAGWFHRGTQAQGRLIREIAAVLSDDLYKRSGGGGSEEHPDEPCYATWTSPLKWSVDYGKNTDGETVWARVYGPSGVFASAFEISDVRDFEALMP